MEIWLVIALVVLLLVFIGIRKRKSATGREAADERRVDNRAAKKSTPYHAVSLKPGPGACRTAMALKGQRFLSADAPPLPVRGCTSVNCQCSYVHYPDRRGRNDRRGELPRGFGLTGETGEIEVDRRRLRDRRSDDDDGYF